MRQKTEAEVLAEYQGHIKGNREEINKSRYGGCVSCCAVFDAKDIVDWQDEWIAPEQQNRARRWTAMCPRCGSPSVVGSSTGLLDDQSYLPIVNNIVTQQAMKRR